MFNSMDLLVIVFLALAGISLLALALMFLIRNEKVKKISLFAVAGLGIYISTVCARIMQFAFPVQLVLGIALGLMAVAAIVLQIKAKDDPKLATLARILAAVSLVVGMINAFS